MSRVESPRARNRPPSAAGRTAPRPPPASPQAPHSAPTKIGWYYLSNATCLMRPRLFYAMLVVSMIIIICYIIRHF